jgi:glycosyltransferase involved in cell wall biosynthesis
VSVDTVGHDPYAGQNDPAPVGAAAGVTRFLYELYLRRKDLRREFPDLDGPDGARLVEWAHVHGRDEVPIAEILLPEVAPDAREAYAERRGDADAASRPVPEDPLFGANLIGFLKGEFGLGEAARQLVLALDTAGIPLLPLDQAFVPSCRHEHAYATLGMSAASFPINIVCGNIEGTWGLAREVGPEFLTDRHSIGVWWWEVDTPIPTEWHLGASLLDEVWTGSEFVTQTLRRSLTLPVRTVTVPVTVPTVAPLDRRELGLPDDFLFLFIFDHNSVLARKNPLGLIDAFSKAFPPGSGATLMIKTINAHVDETGHAQLAERATEHPDVQVLHRYLSPQVKNALMATCDCYVSLHRAEGFGLTMAEAMYLAKPVIATGYSGNLDYMDRRNSHLVDYEMVPIGSGSAPYPPNGLWAEPDVEHAAYLMREVFEHQRAARELGRRAAGAIRQTHSPEAAAKSITGALDPARAAIARAVVARPESRWPEGDSEVMDLLARGPVPPPTSAAGPLGGPLRRALLRLMRPYTAYQREVNLALARELAERDASAAQAELHHARTRAGLLAAIRRLERKLAESASSAASSA